jgi:hypothetical protein
MLPARYQPGEVRHVDEQIRPDAVGDLAKPGELEHAAVGRAAGDDEFRPVLRGQICHLLVVNPPVLPTDAVLNGVEPFAGLVGRRPVGQMAPGVEAHSEDRVTRLARAMNTAWLAWLPELG